MSNYLSPGSTSHKISQNCRGSCQLPLQITDYGMQIVATTFPMIPASAHRLLLSRKVRGRVGNLRSQHVSAAQSNHPLRRDRSEERRVGKECSSWLVAG